jgi:hypothetical protein
MSKAKSGVNTRRRRLVAPSRTSELYESLLHEYGHAVAAKQFGGFGYVQITELESPGRPARQRFTGVFYLTNALDMSAQARRVVGLAGVVADFVAILGLANLDGNTIYDLSLRVSCLSASDAEMAKGYGPDDVCTTVALVRERWDEIKEAAIFDLRHRYRAFARI